MDSPLLLSVVMPTCNKAALLDRTLGALARQQVDGAWEAVVVDDGSTDATAEVLARRTREFPAPLGVVRPGRNVGRARARNLGIAEARGRWVLFLDDDILAPPGLLQAHLDLLAGDESAGVIGYAVTDPDLADGPHFRYLDTRGAAKLPAGPAPARYFVTQNASAPRRALEQVGGFDEDFSAYGFEDMELAFRLEDGAGVSFRVLTSPVPLHIHHHTLRQYLEKKVLCGRSSLATLARLHPGRLREMNLHWVVDPPGAHPGLLTRLARAQLRPAGAAARFLVERWPCHGPARPCCERLYFAVMNLAVLSCFARGLREKADR